MDTLEILHVANDGVSYGVAPLVVAGAVKAGAALLKGIGSLFGRRKKRRAAAAAAKKKAEMEKKVMNFKFKNAFEGMEGASYTPSQAEAGVLASAAQSGMPILGSAQSYAAQGYSPEGYAAEGYNAQTTNVDGLLTGADTGLKNEFRNLEVSTAASDLAAQEADQSLAATQDLAAQAGTGGGGATALAAAAAKSKAGISADIDRQVKDNNIRRAQGEMQLQREQLAQGNLASQFDLGQQQFNAGAVNSASQFSANARNQAAAFNASAINDAGRFQAAAYNQAAQFGASAANQFSLSKFGAEAQNNQYNASQQNQFALQQFAANNQFNLQNMSAQNDAAKFAASTSFQADSMSRQGAQSVNQNQYNRLAGMMGVRQSESAQAQNAYQRQKDKFGAALGSAVDSFAGGVAGAAAKQAPGTSFGKMFKN